MTDDADNFPARILIVDDQQSMCEMLVDTLTPNGLEVEWKTKATQAIELLKDRVFDVVLTDLKMPDMNGIEFCQEVNRNHPELPVVVMTAFGSFEAAVSAIRAGAFDFVTKPLEIDLLDIALARAVKQSRLQQQVRQLKNLSRHWSLVWGINRQESRDAEPLQTTVASRCSRHDCANHR